MNLQRLKRALIAYVNTTQGDKNLVDSDLWLPYFDKLEDGSYKSKQYITTSNRVAVHLLAGDYTLSIDIKCESGKNYKPCFYDTDGTRIEYKSYVTSTGDWVNLTWTFQSSKDIVSMGWYYSAPSNQLYFKNFQIEKADTE